MNTSTSSAPAARRTIIKLSAAEAALAKTRADLLVSIRRNNATITHGIEGDYFQQGCQMEARSLLAFLDWNMRELGAARVAAIRREGNATYKRILGVIRRREAVASGASVPVPAGRDFASLNGNGVAA